MPRFTIKIPRTPNIKTPEFSSAQMREIGEHSIAVMKERVADLKDVFDQPVKPLTPKYAKQKAKKGLPPVRDMHYTGLTLQAVQVLESDSTHVKVGIKGSPQYRKGLFNQNIDPWFGLSDHDDERVLNEKIRPTFAANIEDATKS